MANLFDPGQNGANDPFKCIFLKDQFTILIHPSLKIVSEGSIDNNSVLVQAMTLCWAGDKP